MVRGESMIREPSWVARPEGVAASFQLANSSASWKLAATLSTPFEDSGRATLFFQCKQFENFLMQNAVTDEDIGAVDVGLAVPIGESAAGLFDNRLDRG